MAHDPNKPLLRLNQPTPVAKRRSGGGGEPARKFERAGQVQTHGPVFTQLRNVLNAPNPAMQLRADANSLAPERLLVFEVTGSVTNFANAVAKIAGLEFAGEEELEADELDESPEFYLLVPQLAALREIVSLWERWRETGSVPRGFTPWRDLFEQLKSVRPWGPSDRVSPLNREFLRNSVDGEADDVLIRTEIELIFRASEAAAATAYQDLLARLGAVGGVVIQHARRPEFAYDAVLTDLPAAEIRRIVNLDPASLAGAEPIANITPQSVGTPIEAADRLGEQINRPPVGDGAPIAAVFDAVPVQAHPLLAGRIVVDDPADLEAQAVGPRVHGTAMASLAIHGDLNEAASPIGRRIYFRPVMYAPVLGDEKFQSDRLVIDVIVEAVARMRAAGGADVIVVNLSLGDATKPFAGKISTWGRALDYLAFTYGILFLVSAGNCGDGVPIAYGSVAEFEAATAEERALAIFRGLDAVKADRRLLAPADSINALAIGAWHRDSVQQPFPGASPFAPYNTAEMPNMSSRLGPGLRRGTKPEALFAGGKQRARFHPTAAPPILMSHATPGRYWGLRVAAPPENGIHGTHFTVGTSAATGLATHTAHRIYDAIALAYPDLLAAMPLAERAALIKALLVHSASWRDADAFIKSVVDPEDNLHNEHWRREVCRHLGYGFVDPEDAVACAADRATLWATGSLGPEGSLTFDLPIPAEIAQNAQNRAVRATLAWFAPIRPGHLAYRAIKLKIDSLRDNSLHVAGVTTSSNQPSNSQSESGTIVHRHWRGASIGNGQAATIPVQIQREKDRGTPIDDPIPFGLAITIEMPGAVQIYDQIRAAIAVKPRAAVAV
jgi:hypothetical protein